MKDSPDGEVIKAVREVSAGRVYFCSEAQEVLFREVRNAGKGGARLDDLPERQQDVLHRVLEGKPSKRIAEELCLSIKTVETYRSRIKSKLGCSNDVELVRWAYDNGILVPERLDPRIKAQLSMP